PDLVLRENVPFQELLPLLKRADVFALSSRWEKGICGEGFAIALLEAGAACRPVVTTNSCGVAELMQDGVNGRVVPTEDPEALAGAICDVLENPQSARQMAERLHERVVGEFTLVDVYRKSRQLL